MGVEIQRGFDSRVSQLLLSDLGGNADVIQERCMYMAQLMPRNALDPCRFCSRPQDALQNIACAARAAQLVWEE